MLINLHVKNLALIEEEDIDFEDGLNILSGETGAGKSIILGSINAALGAKTSPDFIRSGCEYGLAEITFAVPEDKIDFSMKASAKDFKDEKNTFCDCLISTTELWFYFPLAVVSTVVVIITLVC